MLQEGQGECPPRGAQCQVHYVARLVPKEPASEGEKLAFARAIAIVEPASETMRSHDSDTRLHLLHIAGELEAASSSAPVMDTRQESLEPKRVTAGVPEVPT